MASEDDIKQAQLEMRQQAASAYRTKATNATQQVAKQEMVKAKNEQLVKELQRQHGLKVDGFAGPKTQSRLVGLGLIKAKAGAPRAVNQTGNARSGRSYKEIPTRGGVIHDYGNGERVFVSKPAKTAPSLHVSGTSGGGDRSYASTGARDAGSRASNSRDRLTKHRPAGSTIVRVGDHFEPYGKASRKSKRSYS